MVFNNMSHVSPDQDRTGCSGALETFGTYRDQTRAYRLQMILLYVTVVEDIVLTKEKHMNAVLVDTAKVEFSGKQISYARTESGHVDTNAYIGLDGSITANSLSVDVKIIGARIRYGHLDLRVTPVAGAGDVWVERKNITIPEDPALPKKIELSVTVKEPENGFSNDIKQLIQNMTNREVVTSN